MNSKLLVRSSHLSKLKVKCQVNVFSMELNIFYYKGKNMQKE